VFASFIDAICADIDRNGQEEIRHLHLPIHAVHVTAIRL
jgi:hypothetical protein